jgi:hydroxymethylbilane synthase
MRLPIRIGTRGSPMALAQANIVRERLEGLIRGGPNEKCCEIIVINTIADRVLDRPLAEIGGKGLFIKELEQALFDDRIDIAVHSMKDVETELPDGLKIGCVLTRDDPRDAFISHKYAALDEMPSGAVVGTSSLRRQAQLLHRRSDLKIVPLRGNANTRLSKLAAGNCDATFLAVCGLRRIGLEGVVKQILSTDEMLPAVAQGAVGVEMRAADSELQEALAPLNCSVSQIAVEAERSVLAALHGTCRTPVGVYAVLERDTVRIRGLLASPDGSSVWASEREGSVRDATRLGADLGSELRKKSGPGFGLDLN